MFEIFSKIMKFIKQYHMYQVARKELSSLSDYELNDIGVSRCDIDRISWQSTGKNI